MNQKCKTVSIADYQLTAELSSHFEHNHKLPPLASKIYSIFILSKNEEFTFDEILDLTGASKSSVSNQINFLIEEGRVDFTFKNDKRKRYFKTKCDYLKKTLELHLDEIEKEIEMLSKVIHYKKEQNLNQNDVSIFKNHLKSEKENILDTLNELEQTSTT